MTSIPDSNPTSTSSPKPPRNPLPRSPSAPIHLASQADPQPPQQIYVLSADGSRLFLLDPTKPGNEEPPPYAPFQPPTSGHATTRSSSSTNLSGGLTAPASPARIHANALASPQRLGHGQLLLPSAGSGSGTEDTHTRHRARTLSALNVNTQSQRPRYRTFASHSHSPPGPSSHSRPRSATSSPGFSHRVRLVDETTPLLARADDEPVGPPQRGLWRSVFCGDVDVEEDTSTWARGWRRYWRPWQRKEYWRASLHLILLNFPFALAIWPWLVIGTLVGTALLITLPIGAAIWWITLFLSRSSARLELRYHSPLNPTVVEPSYHPIFYRVKERSNPSSPISPMSEFPPEIQWETRFVKCSYAMFADHYSYSALSYFLLIKPLITLFSTILIVALFPVCLVLVFPMPVYLRAIRRWGKWQAGIAMGNL